MSITDELEKLHVLKEKGVLSEKEFDAKKAQMLNASDQEKKKKPRSDLKMLFASIGIVVGGIGLLSAIGSLNGGAELPSCDSETATSTLKNAFDQAQFAKANNLSAIEVTGAKEQVYDKTTGVRACEAGIVMNNTSTANVRYRMEQRDGGEFMLTFEVD